MLINFCGGSFCASTKKEAWTHVLANEIGAKIIGLGKSGSAHEHAIKTFNNTANITIFSWPEYNRVYHETEGINIASVMAEKDRLPIYKAAYYYYKYIHNIQYAKDRQIRDLYWFDREVLSNYKGKIIHTYCSEPTYSFINGITPIVWTDRLSINTKPKANHMTYEQNKKFAKVLLKYIS